MPARAKFGGARRAKYPRLERAEEDQILILDGEEEDRAAPPGLAEEETGGGGSSGSSSKKVTFAFLPAKYEPLPGWGGGGGGGGGEQQAAPPGAERKSKKRKRKLRRYCKNVGKVLRKGCHYLVLGLQGLANAYSSPFGVAASVTTTVLR